MDSPHTAGQAARRTRVRVRYADTDQMGVVYYANYLVWFEVARTEWLREGGWTYREMEASGFSKIEIQQMIGFAAYWVFNIVFTQSATAGLADE